MKHARCKCHIAAIIMAMDRADFSNGRQSDPKKVNSQMILSEIYPFSTFSKGVSGPTGIFIDRSKHCEVIVKLEKQ